MPVKWLLHWQPNAGTQADFQILTEVNQCIERIHSVLYGEWKATLNFCKPTLREQANALEFPREFWGISLQEQPYRYYMVLREQRVIMETESSIQEIPEKLQCYTSRVAFNFQGLEYRLGDYLFRVGRVSPINSENVRGIVMEMEYLLDSSWAKSYYEMSNFFDILKEAVRVRSLPGHFVHFEPKFAEYGLSDIYSSQHTAVQYASTISEMIAAYQSSEAARK